MDVIGKSFHSRGKLRRISDQPAWRVPSLRLPARINDNVLVACVLHAAGSNIIRHRPNLPFIDGEVKCIPRVPTHWRSRRETVFYSERPRRCAKPDPTQSQDQPDSISGRQLEPQITQSYAHLQSHNCITYFAVLLSMQNEAQMACAI